MGPLINCCPLTLAALDLSTVVSTYAYTAFRQWRCKEGLGIDIGQLLDGESGCLEFCSRSHCRATAVASIKSRFCTSKNVHRCLHHNELRNYHKSFRKKSDHSCSSPNSGTSTRADKQCARGVTVPVRAESRRTLGCIEIRPTSSLDQIYVVRFQQRLRDD
jgi:hypothetical protein